MFSCTKCTAYVVVGEMRALGYGTRVVTVAADGLGPSVYTFAWVRVHSDRSLEHSRSPIGIPGIRN